jgi:hypothetical protein
MLSVVSRTGLFQETMPGDGRMHSGVKGASHRIQAVRPLFDYAQRPLLFSLFEICH